MSYFCSICAQIMVQVINVNTFEYKCAFHQDFTLQPASSVLMSSDQQKQDSLRKTFINEELNQRSDVKCPTCEQYKFIIFGEESSKHVCKCNQHQQKNIDKSLFIPGKRSVIVEEKNAKNFFHVMKSK